jgi:hypothetical protein
MTNKLVYPFVRNDDVPNQGTFRHHMKEATGHQKGKTDYRRQGLEAAKEGSPIADDQDHIAKVASRKKRGHLVLSLSVCLRRPFLLVFADRFCRSKG